LRTKMFLAGAMIAAGAGVLAAVPAAAAPDVTAQATCYADYVNFDPDEGAGEGWSKCAPLDAVYHRVKLTCSGPGGYYTAYGDWAYSQAYSSTTCYGGHVAYGATYELR
jgi:hypothetical protein